MPFELVEKPTVFRQFAGFMQFLESRNCIKPQGVGCAGEARLAHEIYIKGFFDCQFVILLRGIRNTPALCMCACRQDRQHKGYTQTDK